MTSAVTGPFRDLRHRLALIALLAAPFASSSALAYWAWEARALDAAAAEREISVAALERRVAALERSPSPSPTLDSTAIYLPGETGALAKAALQRLLIDAIDKSSGRLIEVDGSDMLAGDEADAARLRLTFDIRNAGLFDLLLGLETGVPLLTIERIEIRRAEEDLASDQIDPTLRVLLLVSGRSAIGKG